MTNGLDSVTTPIVHRVIYQQPFLASMPLAWVLKAGNLPGKALHVALVIRHLAKLEGASEVLLKNKYLKAMSISRDSKRRALENLEQAGLIEVIKRKGGNPQVRIINS